MTENQSAGGGFSPREILSNLKTRVLSFLHRLWRMFVGEVKAEVAETVSRPLSRDEEWQAAEELMALYRAWLGYLLYRLDETEVHAPVADVSRALDELSCMTAREGDEYVIRIQRREGEVTAHGADHTAEHDE